MIEEIKKVTTTIKSGTLNSLQGFWSEDTNILILKSDQSVDFLNEGEPYSLNLDEERLVFLYELSLSQDGSFSKAMGGVLEWPASLTSQLKIGFSIKNDGCGYLLFNNEPVTCFAKESLRSCRYSSVVQLFLRNVDGGQFFELSTDWYNLRSLVIDSCQSILHLEELGALRNLVELGVSRCSMLHNINALDGLTELTSLDLSECKSIRSLDGLRNLSKITNLNLNGCLSLTNLDQLKSLRLVSLELSQCRSLNDINALSGMKSLTSLDLSYCQISNLDALKGLHGLTKLDLTNCQYITDLDFLTELSNLSFLKLKSCSSLVSLKGLKGIEEFLDLDLTWCESITNLEDLRELRDLKSLTMHGCGSLANIDALSEHLNLTNLILCGCQSLANIEPLGRLKNLQELDISWCESIKQFEGLKDLRNLVNLKLDGSLCLTNLGSLKELKNLTKLTVSDCLDLQDLEGLSAILRLEELELIQCESLQNLDPLVGLEKLTHLSLIECYSLTKVDALSSLVNLTNLKLNQCFSLESISALKNLKKLNNLELSGCNSLTNTFFLSHLAGLEDLNLKDCSLLTSLDGLGGLENLASLNVSNCPYLKEISVLKNCLNLRKLESDDPVEQARVLSQTGKTDEAFIKDQTSEWLKVVKRAPKPDLLIIDLSETFALYAQEEWGGDALEQLLDFILSREGRDESVWKNFLSALSKCKEEKIQAILEVKVLPAAQGEQLAASILRPLLSIMCSFPDTLFTWVNEQVDQMINLHSTSFLRDYGPSICLFYARMKRDGKVSEWLEKLTEPSVPRWRDRIYLALAKWEMERGDVENPRLRLKEMNQGSEKDELLELLAIHFAKEKPLEAGALLDQISEEWRQLSLSEELVKVPNFTEPAENAYRLLLHMECEPGKLADWVVALLQNNPGNQLAKQLARRFGPQMQENRQLKNIFNEFADHTALQDVTRRKDMDTFKALIEQNPDRLKSIFLSGLLLEMKREDMIKQEDLEDVFNQFGQAVTEGV